VSNAADGQAGPAAPQRAQTLAETWWSRRRSAMRGRPPVSAAIPWADRSRHRRHSTMHRLS